MAQSFACALNCLKPFLAMPSISGVRKIHGEWTAAEISAAKDYWKKASEERVKQMKSKGFNISKITIPLPYAKNLKTYTRDCKVKAELKPFQTINVYRLDPRFLD